MSGGSPSSVVAPSGSGLFSQDFWGIDRHELIAAAAQQHLSERARQNVARITARLGEGITLDQLAGWADQIKRRKPLPTDDPDTVEFLNDPRNRQQDQWHYVNLPLDATGYSREDYPKFTRDDDVVQTIAAGIRVLAGHSDRFSELNALRIVVHCVGDVFQPVHVGCGYIDNDAEPPRLVFDPAIAAARDLRSDTGGNALLLPLGTQGVSLHSYWDSRLGGHVALEEIGVDAMESPELDAATRRALVDKLLAHMSASAAALSGSALAPPFERWPIAWANDSLAAARAAYQSLSIDRRVAPASRSFFVHWEGQDAYVARCKPIVLQRLSGAARGLADLLNGLWA